MVHTFVPFYISCYFCGPLKNKFRSTNLMLKKKKLFQSDYPNYRRRCMSFLGHFLRVCYENFILFASFSVFASHFPPFLAPFIPPFLLILFYFFFLFCARNLTQGIRYAEHVCAPPLGPSPNSGPFYFA